MNDDTRVRPDLSPEDVYRLWLEAYEEDNRITTVHHAARLGMAYGIYMGRWWMGHDKLESSKLTPFDLGKPLELEGDFLIIGDIHVPFTDYDWLGLVTAIAKKHLKRPRKLIVAGDLFSFDIFSSYARVIFMPSWSDEKKAAQKVAADLSRVFDNIWILMGNHERRLSKATDAELSESDIADLLKINVMKVLMSRFGYCNVRSGGQAYRVTHSRSYRQQQLSVANELAQKWQCNVITNHSHHLAKGWDKFKRFVVVDNGCLVDPLALPYVSLDDTTSPGMAQGFTLLRDGTAQLFGKEPFTRWQDWL